jgi:hypothetical protein
MASELPFDDNNAQSGYITSAACPSLAHTVVGGRPVFTQSLAAEPTKARISLACTWDECEISFSSPEDLTNHLTEHSQEVLARWVRHTGCTWKGCKSKATFKTPKQYSDHLKHIHSHPLVCNTPRCSHKKPFRNEADLDRHKRNAHLKEQKWECPYDSCEAETRTFARKDKWLKHIRETQHQNDAFCPFFHCSLKQQKTSKGFADRKEISQHFASKHSGDPESRYECALGSCSGDLKLDFWTPEGLCGHVIDHHGVYVHFYLPVEILKEERVLGNQHLRLCQQRFPPSSSRKYHDCTICAPQNQPEI